MEYLVFTIGTEEYGIDIQAVQELRSYEAVTRLANAPAFMKGVVNLRGIIVPVIDMRIKLGCDNVPYNAFTVVIILHLRGSTIGMVVDSVSDVTTLTPENIRPAPSLGATVDSSYVIGLGTVEERMLILVDIERLLAADDLGLLEKIAA